jgi:hypothetical protein
VWELCYGDVERPLRVSVRHNNVLLGQLELTLGSFFVDTEFSLFPSSHLGDELQDPGKKGHRKQKSSLSKGLLSEVKDITRRASVNLAIPVMGGRRGSTSRRSSLGVSGKNGKLVIKSFEILTTPDDLHRLKGFQTDADRARMGKIKARRMSMNPTAKKEMVALVLKEMDAEKKRLREERRLQRQADMELDHLAVFKTVTILRSLARSLARSG